MGLINFILRKRRTLYLMLIDIAVMLISAGAAWFIISFQDDLGINLHGVHWDVMLFIAINMACMIIFGVYSIIWRYATLNDSIRCFISLVTGTAIFWFIAEVTHIYVSHIYNLMMFLITVCGIIASRVEYKYFYTRRISTAPAPNENRIRTLIVGGGETGRRIIHEMTDPTCEYEAVGILDDDPDKLYRSMGSVKIVGTIPDLPKIVKMLDVELVMVAIPSCSKEEKDRILAICSQAEGCKIKVLPHVHQLILSGSLLSQLHSVAPEELLGRDVIKFDEEKNAQLIRGRVCMVTGGGGSIGSELSRQIAKHKPKQLIIVDIYENNAYDIQQELKIEYGNRLDLQVRIASVRDFKKMDALFEQYKPELLFHAAAHKHVPLMEDSPEEAIKNNVIGTYNTAILAEKHGVKKFVLVSTDKAVNPTNVMGATKRCCEMIIEYMAQKRSKTEFVAVRFGNVLGSNGSVIPLFKRQIQNGGPVTVTHKDIIRYFMTIPEAVSLILQAASFAHGGEIFVLDMGEPVKIVTLAENLIRLMGKEPYVDIDIEFTGLRPGEKLYEELLMSEEGLAKTENRKIFIGKQIEIDADSFLGKLETLRSIAETNNSKAVVDALHRMVPTFQYPAKANAAVIKDSADEEDAEKIVQAANV